MMLLAEVFVFVFAVTFLLLLRLESIMPDLTRIKGQIDRLAVAYGGLQVDVPNLKAENQALRAEINSSQAEIDAEADRLEPIVTGLEALDAQTDPIPPPG